MQFKTISLEDKDWVQKYLKEARYRGCEFSFSTMMMWREHYHTEIAEYAGTLCYRQYSGKSKRYVYAFPAGNGDKKSAIEKIMEMSKEQGKEFKSRSAAEIREYVLAHADSNSRVLGNTSRSKKVLSEVLGIIDEIIEEK